jgi:hypothetical protein
VSVAVSCVLGSSSLSRNARRPSALILLASITLIGGSAAAADRVVRVQSPPALQKDLDAMPRIAEPRDDAERKINAAIARLDTSARKAAAECRKEGRGRSWYERNVSVPMRGPRFIAYTITDNAFCGGAHPSVGTMAIVYDLATGSPVDWTALLPPSLTGTIALSTEMDGTKMVTLRSKRLHALYLERYRPQGNDSNVDAADEECREAVTRGESAEAPAITVWPDAKEGGLATRFEVAHAVQACVDDVVIPAATLRIEGAKTVLIEALEKAHSAHLKR